jgi:hypothetical protein
VIQVWRASSEATLYQDSQGSRFLILLTTENTAL